MKSVKIENNKFGDEKVIMREEMVALKEKLTKLELEKQYLTQENVQLKDNENRVANELKSFGIEQTKMKEEYQTLRRENLSLQQQKCNVDRQFKASELEKEKLVEQKKKLEDKLKDLQKLPFDSRKNFITPSFVKETNLSQLDFTEMPLNYSISAGLHMIFEEKLNPNYESWYKNIMRRLTTYSKHLSESNDILLIKESGYRFSNDFNYTKEIGQVIPKDWSVDTIVHVKILHPNDNTRTCGKIEHTLKVLIFARTNFCAISRRGPKMREI